MTQYKKLFSKSEIEYITPFLKLWMSFNNWYKQDLVGVNRDADAINSYKESGKIKNEFLRSFNDTSESGIEFNISLYELIFNLRNYPLSYPNGDTVDYRENLIYENIDGRSGLNPIYISETKRRFQIPADKKEEFFEDTLEIIYQIRCNLVHGSFDIENQYFAKLVESSYKILYPIMERILQNQADGEFVCKSTSKNVEAIAIFDNGKMIVQAGSRVAKEVADSYDKKEEREQILAENAVERDNFYEITQQIEFSSPSAASSFCLGNSSNGWQDWKNRSGRTMSDVLRNNN